MYKPKLSTHINRVRFDIESSSGAQNAIPTPGLAGRPTAPMSPVIPDDVAIDPTDDSSGPRGVPTAHIDVLAEEFDDDMATISDELESLYDPNDRPIDLPPSRQSSVDLDKFLDDPSDEESLTSRYAEEEAISAIDTWLPWYPLRKKEHVAALLLLGNGRNLLSTAQYKRIRCILKKVLNVDLPDLGLYHLPWPQM
ncbi:uncharacterized protein MELLADRAFT_60699 [Melampsora larici-populina 98AG31]|uniref:Uncharacterized protein n=1 Tax=Melampsora larici-populina (strain 98AG31 / pathotype 3-4-7) TaxID=747676 RepID=F4RC05_MELLP|nr:uncharacterized protein MELLADRAFT_60699 [Melampsora larici-populina 98AG31]EGG10193.1 hypothetical protein MELLADRAFT_60699 [Melampsora larici-populina 98AG31]